MMTINDGMTVLRAALYERVSTEEQAIHGYSIETQIDNLTEYCKAKGHRIVDHYTDEGFSGSLPPLKRPALKRLLEDVQAGKIDIILFTKLDRWFRSVEEYFKVQETLEKHHVEWKAIHEDFNTTSANGRLATTIFLAIAQNEREKSGERVKAVFAHKIKHREACFGGKPPFGYMKQKVNGIPRFVKNPEEQQATEAFWDIMIQTGNLTKAAKHMHDVYGVQYGLTAWSNMIRKDFYCGWYGDIKDFCEAYITREQWQAVLAARPAKRTKTGHVYLFTGMIKCPECGKTLTVTTNPDRKGISYHNYCCRNTNTNVCSWKHHIAEISTEKYLLDHIAELVNLEIEKVNAEKKKAQQKTDHSLPVLKEQLRRLNVMYMSGMASDEEYEQGVSEIKARMAKALKTASSTERNLEPLKQFLAKDFRSAYEKLTPENKRKVWQSVIKEIIVDKNNVIGVKFF